MARSPSSTLSSAARALRLAIVGTGVMGRNHLNAATACGATLVGVLDLDMARAHAAAAEWGVRAFERAADLAGAIDAAVIAAPTAAHMALAQPLLAAGIHCLVEKPLARTPAECRALIDAAAHGDAVLQVGHIERFNPGVEALLAESTDAAAVRKIAARRMNPGSARVKDIDVVMDLMIHDLDVILVLKSGIAVTDVTVQGTGDDALATLHFADGAVATAKASRKTDQRVRDLNVMLAGGFLRLDYLTRALQISRSGPQDDGLSTRHVDAGKGDAAAGQLADFLACAATHGRPRVSGADALAVMEVAWRIQDAMAHGVKTGG